MITVENLTEGIDKYEIYFVRTLQWCGFRDEKQYHHEDIRLSK